VLNISQRHVATHLSYDTMLNDELMGNSVEKIPLTVYVLL